MKLIHDLEQLKQEKAPIVMAAGFFDGVHLGHQKIVGRARERAAALGGHPWVLTFDTHPLRVLNPAAAPPLLTSTQHKLLMLERLGSRGCILLPFDRTLADMAPEAFAARLLGGAPPLVEIVVGCNWHFGRQGSGNPALLARLSAGRAMKVNVMRARVWQGETISSTRIRSAVVSGRLEEAAAMLGRPFSLFGPVGRGKGIGRTLGFPTANLDARNEALPPLGVYAAVATVVEGQPGEHRRAGPAYPSVVNFGTCPTFRGHARRKPGIETHIVNLDRDLYGSTLEVFLIARLRDEQLFSSPKALKDQIGRDIETALAAIGSGLPKKLKEWLYTQSPVPL